MTTTIRCNHWWFENIKLEISPGVRRFVQENTSNNKILSEWKDTDTIFNPVDAEMCFGFLSCGIEQNLFESSVDPYLILNILNTKISPLHSIYALCADVSQGCVSPNGNTIKYEGTIKTYKEFFDMIGYGTLEVKDNEGNIIETFESYIDGVYLNLELKDGNIYYCYSR